MATTILQRILKIIILTDNQASLFDRKKYLSANVAQDMFCPQQFLHNTRDFLTDFLALSLYTTVY